MLGFYLRLMLAPGGIVGKIRWAVSLLMFGACGAAGAGYDDFARGIAANQQGASDQAIAAFTAALAAPDLNVSLTPVAYRGRAIAYLDTKQCALGAADVDSAMKLKPSDHDLLRLHAAAMDCMGKLDAAIADLSTLIAYTETPDAWRTRGYLRWRMANYSGAADDFAAAQQRDPYNAWTVLWLEMARQRAGALDPVLAAKDIKTLDLDEWPQPLLALYAGATTPDKVDAAASRASDKAASRCEADFYVAQWWLGRRDVAAAKPLLDRATADCAAGTFEHAFVGLELERMK